MVAKSRADAVFVLGASHIAAGLAERFPVFHCSDSTFSALLNYHGEFSAFSRRTVRSGTELERRVISRSRAVIVASQAAALSVRRDYGREEGVHVVPFGANLDHLPEIDSWERKPECSLVFIGVQWFSKGADVALEACRLLNERGIPAVLHVVGCSPPPGTNVPPFIKLHGFLRKSVPHEYAQLTSLVAKSDFLIVPTRYEAFGIVFCEAAAHGTPAVSRRTGGVPTIIDDGVTGILVDEGKGPECYADRIQRVWCDEGAYVRMRRAAFTKARSTLNWDSWSAHVESIIRASMGRPSAP
jgi:glycosyltransferase involved in cell wall biosynthesis